MLRSHHTLVDHSMDGSECECDQQIKWRYLQFGALGRFFSAMTAPEISLLGFLPLLSTINCRLKV